MNHSFYSICESIKNKRINENINKFSLILAENQIDFNKYFQEFVVPVVTTGYFKDEEELSQILLTDADENISEPKKLTAAERMLAKMQAKKTDAPAVSAPAIATSPKVQPSATSSPVPPPSSPDEKKDDSEPEWTIDSAVEKARNLIMNTQKFKDGEIAFNKKMYDSNLFDILSSEHGLYDFLHNNGLVSVNGSHAVIKTLAPRDSMTPTSIVAPLQEPVSSKEPEPATGTPETPPAAASRKRGRPKKSQDPQAPPQAATTPITNSPSVSEPKVDEPMDNPQPTPNPITGKRKTPKPQIDSSILANNDKTDNPTKIPTSNGTRTGVNFDFQKRKSSSDMDSLPVDPKDQIKLNPQRGRIGGPPPVDNSTSDQRLPAINKKIQDVKLAFVHNLTLFAHELKARAKGAMDYSIIDGLLQKITPKIQDYNPKVNIHGRDTEKGQLIHKSFNDFKSSLSKQNPMPRPSSPPNSDVSSLRLR